MPPTDRDRETVLPVRALADQAFSRAAGAPLQDCQLFCQLCMRAGPQHINRQTTILIRTGTRLTFTRILKVQGGPNLSGYIHKHALLYDYETKSFYGVP